MRSLSVWVLGLLAVAGCLAQSPVQKQSQVELTGLVVDAQGHPVSNCDIGVAWLNQPGPDGKDRIAPIDGFLSDTRGAFKGLQTISRYPALLVVRNKDQKLGASVLLTEDAVLKPIRVQLQRLTPVHVVLQVEKGWSPRTQIVITSPKGSTFWGFFKGPKLDINLAPGEYLLNVDAPDGNVIHQVFKVSDRSVTLKMPFERNLMARGAGKTAPNLIVSAVRGLKPTFKLTDLRGKWVYIDFWATWCKPCVQESLPSLIALYKKYVGIRNRFEILAFHDETCNNFEQYDRQAATLEKGLWGGPLPFPVLLDASGKTIRTWGIRQFPTGFLIDPEGKIVPEGDLMLLERKLHDILQVEEKQTGSKG